MVTWTLDEPDKLAFDGVDRVLVQIVEGAVDVVGTDDQPSLEVSELLGAPLRVRHEGGALSVGRPGGRADAGTVSGAVQASGVTGDLSAKTVSGDLTVRLPGTSDLRVRLQSASGQVASAFDELEHDRTPGRHAARGRLGTGSGRLRATSASGHVALLRRAPEPETG